MPAGSRRKSPARHARPAPRRARTGVALGLTGVMSAGIALGAGPAAAADKPVSQAKGFFLSGSVLGKDLSSLVELESAAARNDGDPDTVREVNPLSVQLLNSLDLPIGPLNLLQGNGLLSLGAVNQAAIARSNGSAIGASGAVTDSGAIAVGGRDGVPAATATLDLGGFLASNLGDDLLGGLVDLDLEVGAIAASATQAKGKNGEQNGDYRIADLNLQLESPLLAGLLGTLTGPLDALQPTAGGLETDVLALEGLTDLVTGLLGGVLPGVLEVEVTNVPDVGDLLAAVDTTLGDGPVTVDLTTGTITVDVEALLKALGLDLNNLPPNTELVGEILRGLTERVVSLVTDELDDLVDTLTAGVAGIGIEITVAGVPVDVTGTLQDLLDGLLDDLLDDLLAPVTGLLDDLVADTGLLDPLFDALDDVLSLRVNVQSAGGGTFTQRAIQVRVLPGSDVLSLNLASASVGPGTPRVTPDPDDKDEDEDEPELPATGAASTPLAAAGLALVLAGAAATAGSRVGASAGAPARARGRHARR